MCNGRLKMRRIVPLILLIVMPAGMAIAETSLTPLVDIVFLLACFRQEQGSPSRVGSFE